MALNSQYLEARFDRRLRMFGAVMFTIQNVSSNNMNHFLLAQVN